MRSFFTVLLIALLVDFANAFAKSRVRLHIGSVCPKRYKCILLSKIAMQLSFSDHVTGIQSPVDSKKYVAMIKTAAYSSSVTITSADKLQILAEIGVRQSELDDSSLAVCLLLISKLNFDSSDPAVSTIVEDIMESLGSRSFKNSVFEMTASNTIGILNTLIRSGGKWSDLPILARDLLLAKIELTVLLDAASDRYLPDVVWSFGKLRAEFRTLGHGFRNSLLTAVSNMGSGTNVKNVEHREMCDVAKLLYGLSQMKVRWTDDMSDSAKATAILLLSHRSSKMNENEIVNSIYSLGKMECRWSSLPGKTQRNLFVDAQRVSGDMSASAVSNTLWGFGKMSVVWKYMAPETRAALSARLVAVSPMCPHSTSITFTGLNKMGATWASLPVAVRAALESSCPLPSQATEQIVANILHSLGSMGVSYSEDLLDDTKHRLESSFTAVASSFTSQGLSNAVYGLAKMGHQCGDWSERLLGSFEEALFRDRPSSVGRMGDQSVSNIVWSLGQCGAVWPDADRDIDISTIGVGMGVGGFGVKYRVSSESSAMISMSIKNKAHLMSEQGLSNTLMGLAKMQVTWSLLDPRTREALADAVVSRSKVMTQQGLSNTLWALQEMGLRLTPPEREGTGGREGMETGRIGDSLFSAILRLAPDMSGQCYSTIMYSLGVMGCQYPSLSPKIRIALEGVCSREGPEMGTKETSMALYGLAKMKLSFEYLSSNIRISLMSRVTATCGSMDEQELGNTVWALGQIGHGVRGQTGDALMAAVVKKQSLLRMQSVLAVLQGLGSPFRRVGEYGEVETDRRRWADLSSSLKAAVTSTLTRLLLPTERYPDERDQRLAGTSLYWLGCLQAYYHDLPDELRYQLISQIGTSRSRDIEGSPSDSNNEREGNLESKRESKRERDAAAVHPTVQALNAIASMGSTWGLLEKWERDALQHAVTNCLAGQFERRSTGDEKTSPLSPSSPSSSSSPPSSPPLSPSPLSSRMSFASPSTSMKSSRVQGTDKPHTALNQREVSSLLWSLGRMGLQIGSLTSSSSSSSLSSSSSSPSTLPDRDTDIDIEDSIENISTPPPVRTASVLERDLLSALEATASSMSAHEIAWCLWSLARMGVTFADLIADKRPLGSILLLAVNRHIGDMKERELGIVLWAVGRLQYPVNDFPLVLREALYQGIETMVAIKLGLGRKTGGGTRGGVGAGGGREGGGGGWAGGTEE